MTMDPNDNNNNNNINNSDMGSTANDAAAAKRQALTGQWRTPPLPVFPSMSVPAAAAAGHHHHYQQQEQQQVMEPSIDIAMNVQHPGAPHNITLPESTDDYAKALQEAYRRGAQAAAAMQQQQQVSTTMSNAVSCPNFHQHLPLGTTKTTTTTAHESFTTNVPTTTVTTEQQQPIRLLAPNPLTNNNMILGGGGVGVVALPHSSSLPENSTSRSFSLPDMASYAARAQVEEEKRKKRLARNRASARLRRLRKKNLVCMDITHTILVFWSAYTHSHTHSPFSCSFF